MKRKSMLRRLGESSQPWDVIIIGGGATGLGAAVESASRGYRTLLLEQDDFCKATSSRSTKLIHGGVRYLARGDVSLVRDALRERGLLMRNASHVVHRMGLVIPRYRWYEGAYYGAGLKLYDWLAGDLNLGSSRLLSRADTLRLLPTLEPKGLRGGVLYYDGQFDDSRLALALARTAADQGATLLNYLRVTGLLKRGSKISGVKAEDRLSGQTMEVPGKVVVNATGVFSDSMRRTDNPQAEEIVAASRGSHLVLDRSFLPSDTAVLIPKTQDGRVLFLIPWQGRTLVGTTDIAMQDKPLELSPLQQEIEYILAHAAQYLTRDPKREDILSMFTGLRPLVRGESGEATKSLSRDHTLLVSDSGLVTITGGKWTTYRKMAQDTLDRAAQAGGLPSSESVTASLRLHGWRDTGQAGGRFARYGSDAQYLEELIASDESLGRPLHERLPYCRAEVVWAVSQEMACRVEDVLSRRLRALLLDAEASMACAPEVARLMAKHLGENESWAQRECDRFTTLAQGYLPARA
ncbi:MAG TPA: glycerol-3-phosphate dehydrogenase/oxidase [Acidobacteriota bacterium]|nr:glycerol-3-phosphate dehydrogenase/oxidase [Acidobacteriota bacterium]